ncbi:MAG: IS91 family transposase [Anaerolinea sp.]|nr:IS91 family transposase [Anaerolinea sp.]
MPPNIDPLGTTASCRVGAALSLSKGAAHKAKPERPPYELADILRKYLPAYRRRHKLSYEQSRAVRAIMNCRTPALGGLLKVCTGCGRWDFSFKSCKNRHCPKCGSFEKAQWLEAQKVWLLPIHYYHVVFTIDHVFNRLVWRNQEALYTLLIQTAAQKLKEYGQKYLGGEIGFTLILHTWGQTMQQHLHVHFIVTGGALVSTPGGYRWQAAKRKYLFPVKLLSKDFQRAFCAGVRKLWQDGHLDTANGELDAAAMLAEAEGKDWEVYIQAPLYGVEKLLDYLGRYVFRIAISNHRIVTMERDTVTFKYYDNRDDGKLKQMTLSAEEFIGRFLMHVLPSHFVRIRHYGLHHGSCRNKLQQARHSLGLPFELPIIVRLKLIEWLKMVLERTANPRLCPTCGKGIMVPVRTLAPMTGWQAQLSSLLGVFTRWQVAAT